MPKPRLTKATLRAWCEAEIEHLCAVNQFDPKKGIGQLEGRNQSALIAWGRILGLSSVMESFTNV